MTDQERDAVLGICLLAALCDGANDDSEKAEIDRISRTLAGGGGADLAALHQDVQAGRRTLESSAGALGSPEARQLAYELAVCVCNADGAQSAPEAEFLGRLHRALGLEPAAVAAFSRQAEAVAALALPPASRGAGAGAPPGTPDPAEIDQWILSASILNGALDLLPHSLATLAVIPLQMRLVYRVGRAYGYELDQGHVRDLLATVGVGLTSQAIEQVGRRLVGGLLRAVGGGMLGSLGSQATGTALSFATTYALGQVAKRYYAGGRVIDAEGLRQVFEQMLGEARGLGERYAGEMQQKARSIDVGHLVESIRSG